MAELTSNINYLQPSGFSVSISRENYPNLEYFAQQISHPSIDVAETMQAARKIQIPTAGDTVTFGTLDVTFLLDEDMTSYTEMFDWMVRLVNENQTDQTAAIAAGTPSTEADIYVSILSSHNNVIKTIKYYNCVPTSVSNLELNAQLGAEIPLTFNVSFRCLQFELV